MVFFPVMLRGFPGCSCKSKLEEVPSNVYLRIQDVLQVNIQLCVVWLTSGAYGQCDKGGDIGVCPHILKGPYQVCKH